MFDKTFIISILINLVTHSAADGHDDDLLSPKLWYPDCRLCFEDIITTFWKSILQQWDVVRLPPPHLPPRPTPPKQTLGGLAPHQTVEDKLVLSWGRQQDTRRGREDGEDMRTWGGEDVRSVPECLSEVSSLLLCWRQRWRHSGDLPQPLILTASSALRPTATLTHPPVIIVVNFQRNFLDFIYKNTKSSS